MNITPLNARLFNQPIAITEAGLAELLQNGGLVTPRTPAGNVDEDYEHEPSPVRYVPVFGPISKHLSREATEDGWCSLDRVSALLKVCAQDPYCERVLMHYHTPGGMCIGGLEMFRQIRELDVIKPVVSFCDSVCGSLGLYFASAARRFYVTESAMVGAVGTRVEVLDVSEMLARVGIKAKCIKSGKFKDIGTQDRPMTGEEERLIQATVDRLGEEFRSALLSQRNIAREDMEGQLFGGIEAVVKGFADGTVDDLDEAVGLLMRL